MQTLLSPQFYLDLFLYLISVLVCFVVPGFFLERFLVQSPRQLTRFVIAVSLGISAFGMFSYITGYLGLRFLGYAYVAIGILLFLIHFRKIFSFFHQSVRGFFSIDKWCLVLIALSIIIPSLQMVGSGLRWESGIRLYRINGFDGMMHLSFIQSLARSFPPEHPNYDGLYITNYHYWSDLLLAEQVRLFGIKTEHIFFQFAPFFFSSLIAIGCLALTRELTRNVLTSRLSLFFLLFGGDLLYIPMYMIQGEFGFWLPAIDNGATQFLNMPHAQAKAVFFAAVLAIFLWMKAPSIKKGIAMVTLSAVLFGLKIYFGLYVAIGLLCVFVYKGLSALWSIAATYSAHKRIEESKRAFLWSLVLIGLVYIGLFASIYLPPNKGAGGLTYVPLEWPKLLVNQDHLDWKWLRYRYALAEYFKSTPKKTAYELIMVGICLIGMYGTRIIGLLPNKPLLKVLGKERLLFFVPALLIYILLGLNTLQETGGYNTFNFFAMSATVVAVFSAITLAGLWKWNILGKACVAALIILTIPRVLYETKEILSMYRNSTSMTQLSAAQVDAGQYVQSNLPADILIQPHPDNDLDRKTSVVSFLTNRQIYYDTPVVLAFHGHEYAKRADELKEIFSGSSASTFVSSLRDRNIDFLWIEQSDRSKLKFDIDTSGMRTEYENADVTIYSVD